MVSARFVCSISSIKMCIRDRIGALVLATMVNGFNLLQINYYWQMIAKGVVIILAVEIDVLKKASEEAGLTLKEYMFSKKA